MKDLTGVALEELPKLFYLHEACMRILRSRSGMPSGDAAAETDDDTRPICGTELAFVSTAEHVPTM